MSRFNLDHMSPMKRRRFLKMLGAAVASPAIPAALKFDAMSLVVGEAHAQELTDSAPTYFVEINLRDQWDFGHVFVSPGLATHADLRRGTNGTR